MSGKKEQVWKGKMWKAAYKGEIKTLKKAIAKAEHPVNDFDDLKKTPLHYAAEGGSVEAIELLITAGAKVDACFRFGEATPLHLALMARKEDAAIALVKHGADLKLVSPSKSDGWALAAAIGKRFELRIKEAYHPPSFLMTQTATSAAVPSQQTSPASAAPSAAAVQVPEINTANPAIAAAESAAASTPVQMTPRTAASVADLVRMQQQENMAAAAATTTVAVAATSPRNASMATPGSTVPQSSDAMSPSATSSSLTTPRTATGDTPRKGLSKEKADRAAALRRRMAKAESGLKALQCWPEPNKDGIDVKSAAAALRGTLRIKNPTPLPGSTDAKKTEQDTRDLEAALLMIQHLRSWFEPNVPPVILPDWQSPNTPSPRAEDGAAADSATGGAAAAPASAVGATTPRGTVTFEPLPRILVRWCTRMCQMIVDAKDYDVWTMKGNAVRSALDEMRLIHVDLAAQTEAQRAALGDRYESVRDNVDTLRARLDSLVDARNNVALANGEMTLFTNSFMQLIGATYWAHIAINDFTVKSLVASTKEFVSSLLAIGSAPNADMLTIVTCLRLMSVVVGHCFLIKNPEASKQLSEHLTTVFLTVRALVMTVMQGGQRSNEYNLTIGSHLARIKDVISVTVISREGKTLPSKDESAIADTSFRLMAESLAYYEPQVTQDGCKDLLAAMHPLPQAVQEYNRHIALARDTTLHSWLPLVKSMLDLSSSVQKFCDGSLGATVDPHGVFESCNKMCEQCVTQLLIATAALSVENKVCPRHHIPISARALSFTLVAIMDLCYLST